MDFEQLYQEKAEQLRQYHERCRRNLWLMKSNRRLLITIVRLDEEHTSLDVGSSSIDIRIQGNKDLLKKVWNRLRRAGWKTDDRPKDKADAYSGWWHPEDWNYNDPEANGAPPTIYLAFYSTVCKRVQVGTKIVEQPIYEVVCE